MITTQSDILDYSKIHTTSESELLKQLTLEADQKFTGTSMISGHLQGRFLSMISKMIKPKSILELGTYIGYSTICLAEGLKKNGKIITIDIDVRIEEMARKYFEKSKFQNNIDFRIGPALKIIPKLTNKFDLVFLDADKANYINYYNLVLPKVKKGGFIIADNVLWQGNVIKAMRGEEVRSATKIVHEFNELVKNDKKVVHVLLPMRDGLMIVQKV